MYNVTDMMKIHQTLMNAIKLLNRLIKNFKEITI